MKTSYLFRWITILIVVTASCEEEDEPTNIPSQIEFVGENQTLQEGSGSIIKLRLNPPAPGSGRVKVWIETDAIYDKDFKTEPVPAQSTLSLNVYKEQSEVEFAFTALDNSEADGERLVHFSLVSSQESFEIGKNKRLTITIGDNDTPVPERVTVDFEKTSMTLKEGDLAGTDIKILFSKTASVEGKLLIGFLEGQYQTGYWHARYGVDYTTIPALIMGQMALPVSKDQKGAVFKILPIDNSQCFLDKRIYFQFLSPIGPFDLGETSSQYVTLNNDDAGFKATFDQTTGSVWENDATGLNVKISLSEPAASNGSIYIGYPNDKNIISPNESTCTPFDLPKVCLYRVDITAGSSQASLTIKARNNDIMDGNSEIKLSIHSCAVLDGTTFDLTVLDDESDGNKVTVDFITNSISIDETDAGWKEITVMLSRPAAGLGRIFIETWDYGSTYISDPPFEGGYYVPFGLALQVPAGASSAKYLVKPVNNDYCGNSEWKVTHTITAAEGGLFLGASLNTTIAIRDDDKVSYVIPSETELLLNENDGGRMIQLDFSAPSSKSGILRISTQEILRYATKPEMVQIGNNQYEAYKSISKNDLGTNFQIVPLNDGDRNGNYTQSLTVIINGQGCLRFPDNTTYQQFKFTIVDDD